MRRLGAYMRAHSQESVMRIKGSRISVFFFLHCFKDTHRLASVTQSGSSVAFFQIFSYKGKGVVRLNTKYRMYLA